MPKIQLTTTDGTSLEFEITSSPVRFGRAEGNDLVIPDSSVSSHHGEISATGDDIEIVDQGSTNGTFIGGERVERGTVHPGEKFRLGSVDGLVVGEAVETEESPQEEVSTFSGIPAGAEVSGLGATPCPSKMRSGFGPKVKRKNTVGTLLMLSGVLALAVCGVAFYVISTHMSTS